MNDTTKMRNMSRMRLDFIQGEKSLMAWDGYTCSKCQKETRASSLPPYCPVCETWGVMENNV